MNGFATDIRRGLVLMTILLYWLYTSAQPPTIHSLQKKLDTAGNEREKVVAMEGLSYAYLSSRPDSAMHFAIKGLELARELGFIQGEAICLNAIGNVYFHIGDNPRALEYYLNYLKTKENLKDYHGISIAYFNLASVYTEEKDFPHALEYLFKAKSSDEKAKDRSAILFDLYSLSSIYVKMKKADSALYYGQACYQMQTTLGDETMAGAILNTLGDVYLLRGYLQLAENYYRQSIPFVTAVHDDEVLTSSYFGLARVFQKRNLPDSSVHYGRQALAIARAAPFFKLVLEISNFLTGLYSEQRMFDSAFRYQQLTMATKDSMFNTEQAKKVQMLTFDEQLRQEKLRELRAEEEEKRKHYLQLAGIAAFIPMFFGFLLLLKRTRPNPKLMNFLALLTLLMIFEFILLLTHPLVVMLTRDSPVMMLIVQVILAMALFPAHHETQQWLTKILGNKPVAKTQVINTETSSEKAVEPVTKSIETPLSESLEIPPEDSMQISQTTEIPLTESTDGPLTESELSSGTSSP